MSRLHSTTQHKLATRIGRRIDDVGRDLVYKAPELRASWLEAEIWSIVLDALELAGVDVDIDRMGS